MSKVLSLLSVILFSIYVTEQAYFLQKDYIDKINEKATTWKAGVNFDPNTSKEHIFRLLGSKRIQNNENYEMYKTEDDYADSIPRSFDARKKWRYCKTIRLVQDQGNCGSSWALATSSAFADRLCVATKGKFNQLLSTEELTFCCRTCGDGCHGGYPIRAWQHFKRHGIVTGGVYNSGEGCAPYRVSPCPYDDMSGNFTCNGKQTEKHHKCPKKCYGDKTIDFKSDRRHTKDAYFLFYGKIQQDIVAFGPVEASIIVFDDFPSYKSGIYQVSPNASIIGRHSMKLIGWGEEFGVPYWLMVNSWGPTWGDNGLFRIIRGIDECGVDNSSTAGVPEIFL